MKNNIKVCSRCIMDETVPDIVFDERGECNYCKFQDMLAKEYPQGQKGKENFDKLVNEIKKEGLNKPYDCIVGVSGGTDSTYLLLTIKELGLRPLAVNLDNGWHSEIAVDNIKKTLDKLKIDLRTYVIDWEEMKNVHISFLKASLPWVDGPSDLAITLSLYKIANEEGIKYVFIGHDFRKEGRQPDEWTYTDGRMIKAVVKNFGTLKKFRSFPNLTAFRILYYGMFRKIKIIRPYWYLEYNKSAAQKIIEKELNWRYYGEHHHESIFTRFIIGYWLPKKFSIDKRRVTYSALIRSGEMTRELALEKVKKIPYALEKMDEDKEYIIKKLGITPNEFNKLFNQPNKSFRDYPSYYPLFKRFGGIINWLLGLIMPTKPMMTFELIRKKD